MAEKSSNSSGARFRQLIEKIDEKEGSPPKTKTETVSPPPVRPEMPPPAASKAIVPVQDKVDVEPAPRKSFNFWEAFKNFAIVFSFVVNLILVIVLAGLLVYIFDIKRGVAEPLLGGLYNGFVQMDEAHITTTIPVNTTIAVNDKVTADFILPLQQTTNVVLAESTLITGASVTINGGILQLTNAPTTIVLPKGTVLPIILDLSVPVKQDIPVILNIPVSIPVAVDIPLQQTDLHRPFTNLRDLFAPYYLLVKGLPNSWGQAVSGGK